MAMAGGGGEVGDSSSRLRILIAATACESAVHFVRICTKISEWAQVKAVATRDALPFIDRASLEALDIVLYTDNDESSRRNMEGDQPLHLELVRWADWFLIAPLSANTVAKIVGGFCDDLVTCIVVAWDYRKQRFFAARSTSSLMMTKNPFIRRHLRTFSEEIFVYFTPPFEEDDKLINSLKTFKRCVY